MRRLLEHLQRSLLGPGAFTCVLLDHVDGVEPDPDLVARNEQRRQAAIAQLGDKWLAHQESTHEWR